MDASTTSFDPASAGSRHRGSTGQGDSGALLQPPADTRPPPGGGRLRPLRLLRKAPTGILTLVVVASGVLAGVAPVPTATFLVGSLLIGGLVTSSKVRLAWLFGGAMVVFQTDQGAAGLKLVYLAGVSLTVILSCLQLRTALREPWMKRFVPGMYACGALVAYILVVTSVRSIVFQHIGVGPWSRDALTYLLPCAAYVICAAAVAELDQKQARLLVAAVGLVAAAGFAIAWVDRRGLSVSAASDGKQVLLASIVALTVPLALGLVRGFGNPVRPLWIVLVVAVFGAVMVTGTRTGLVFAVALVAVVGSATSHRIPPLRLLLGGVAVIAGTVVLLSILEPLVAADGYVLSRMGSAFQAFEQGITTDQSGLIRARAYEYSQDIFLGHPFMGQGVGVLFPNPNPGGAPSSFSLDTPWVYPAKFGIVGCAVLVTSLAVILISLIRNERGSRSTATTVTWGALAIWIALSPLGAVLEDKGLALSLGMLVLLTGTEARDRVAGRISTPAPAPAPPAAAALPRRGRAR